MNHISRKFINTAIQFPLFQYPRIQEHNGCEIHWIDWPTWQCRAAYTSFIRFTIFYFRRCYLQLFAKNHNKISKSYLERWLKSKRLYHLCQVKDPKNNFKNNSEQQWIYEQIHWIAMTNIFCLNILVYKLGV